LLNVHSIINNVTKIRLHVKRLSQTESASHKQSYLTFKPELYIVGIIAQLLL